MPQQNDDVGALCVQSDCQRPYGSTCVQPNHIHHLVLLGRLKAVLHFFVWAQVLGSYTVNMCRHTCITDTLEVAAAFVPEDGHADNPADAATALVAQRKRHRSWLQREKGPDGHKYAWKQRKIQSQRREVDLGSGQCNHTQHAVVRLGICQVQFIEQCVESIQLENVATCHLHN